MFLKYLNRYNILYVSETFLQQHLPFTNKERRAYIIVYNFPPKQSLLSTSG
jgi:hypothetical protein